MAKPAQQKYDTDQEVLKQQVIIETYRSSGPGGQRKNKRETAVRLRHPLSGITVTATDHRYQAQNLKLAFERLRERLQKLNQPKRRRIPTSVPFGVMEKKREEKKIHSVKKSLRQRPAKDLGEWE